MFSRTAYTKEDFINAVATSFSKAEVLRKLGLKATGANYVLLDFRVKKLQLDTKHFTGKTCLKGKTHNWNRKRPIQEILIEDSDYLSTGNLKKRLIKEGYLKNSCAICGINTWNNRVLVLQLDHINGKRTDNRIENLRILCPNCHSQTETFAGKNMVESCDLKRKEAREKLKERRRALHPIKKPVCPDCGTPVYRELNRCKACAKKHYSEKKIVWPEVSVLREKLKTMPYTKLAKELGVSDNAIRKHLKNYDSKDSCAQGESRTPMSLHGTTGFGPVL